MAAIKNLSNKLFFSKLTSTIMPSSSLFPAVFISCRGIASKLFVGGAPLCAKVIGIYGDLLSAEEVHGSQLSEKGVLQVLFDLKFAADILSGVILVIFFHASTLKKLPTNSESNMMRCSIVPRFKYLPITAPALSVRSAARASVSTSMDDVYSRNSWKSYTNDEISRNSDVDENSSLGVAAPFLKSFMQAGSRFGESTLRLGSMLTDGEVGRFGDM
ncbi:hypothetical protein BUALT_Bualt02G0244400 [Buddleja alternifolia]|uniref:Conserved oligomeric Golgi complex subunit 1 n=1 Tax=Buddleja alternifolia TaxID=168488 RepID=A0AAV6Y773_9LAMI|nr:hypothetical protein BUALT_Bualt02G0244400 [Buddleja alternifolia]